MIELTKKQADQVSGGATMQKPPTDTKPPYVYPKPPVIPFK